MILVKTSQVLRKSLPIAFVFALLACSNSASRTTSRSNGFHSNEDVIKFIDGTTFTQFPLGLTTTVYEGRLVSVESYTEDKAIINVGFDMSEIYGRAVTHYEKYEIDRTSGKYTQLERE